MFQDMGTSMTTPKIIVTRHLPEEVEQRLKFQYDQVQLNVADTPMHSGALEEALRTADAVLLTAMDRFTADILSVEPLRARFLGNFGVGMDHIDLAAAKARGLVVTNTPEVLTEATADLAMTLILMVARRTGEGERYVRSGGWKGWRPTELLGSQVSGKYLGIVGMGRIGRAVAKRAALGFDMEIVYFDPKLPVRQSIGIDGARSCDSLEELLKLSDFVSLHCPGFSETHHLIGPTQFASMKTGAFLINAARGDVVDEIALVRALRSGKLAGAALDVYEKEPSVPRELVEMENVVLLPHLGSATRETRIGMGLRMLENLDAFFSGDPPRDRVV